LVRRQVSTNFFVAFLLRLRRVHLYVRHAVILLLKWLPLFVMEWVGELAVVGVGRIELVLQMRKVMFTGTKLLLKKGLNRGVAVIGVGRVELVLQMRKMGGQGAQVTGKKERERTLRVAQRGTSRRRLLGKTPITLKRLVIKRRVRGVRKVRPSRRGRRGVVQAEGRVVDRKEVEGASSLRVRAEEELPEPPPRVHSQRRAQEVLVLELYPYP